MEIVLIVFGVYIGFALSYLYWETLTGKPRRVFSTIVLECLDWNICWAHSAGGFRRTTHAWVSNCFTGAHCTSCGITTRKAVQTW
jgi:hypothetical protein